VFFDVFTNKPLVFCCTYFVSTLNDESACYYEAKIFQFHPQFPSLRYNKTVSLNSFFWGPRKKWRQFFFEIAEISKKKCGRNEM
jgi:hypothetical protein